VAVAICDPIAPKTHALLPPSTLLLSIWLTGQKNSLGRSTSTGDDCWRWCAFTFTQDVWWEIGWGKCNNQPLSTLNWLVFEMMEGGENVTINGVKDGHWREKEVEDSTITSKHKRASATWSRGEVNVKINLLRPRFDSIGKRDNDRRRNMTIKWIEGG
jgi:hypothetical protein